MKKTNATLQITIDVECPYCKEYTNLLDHPDITADGYIYEMCFDGVTCGCKGIDQIVTCPECGKEFMIEDVEY